MAWDIVKKIAMHLLALAAALATPLVLSAVAAPAQEGGVMVAFALNLPEDGTGRGALASLEPIREFVRGRPGLIDEVLPEGEVGSSGDFLHVTRWERLEDWEAMFLDQAFLELLTATDPQFEATTAEVYTAMP